MTCLASGALWAARQANRESPRVDELFEPAKMVAKGELKLLPNGLEIKQFPATQAKYFYHHEAASDGRSSSETIGFQTHAEMLIHMIKSASSVYRENELIRVWNATVAGTPVNPYPNGDECGEWEAIAENKTD